MHKYLYILSNEYILLTTISLHGGAMGENASKARTTLMFDKTLLDKLRDRAKRNRRSLNAEILYMLEKVMEQERSVAKGT